MPSVPIDCSSNTKLVTGKSKRSIRVRGYNFIVGAAGSIQFFDGDPGGSGVEVTGPYPCAANGGLSAPIAPTSPGVGDQGWFDLSSGGDLWIKTSVAVGGVVQYDFVNEGAAGA